MSTTKLLLTKYGNNIWRLIRLLNLSIDFSFIHVRQSGETYDFRPIQITRNGEFELNSINRPDFRITWRHPNNLPHPIDKTVETNRKNLIEWLVQRGKLDKGQVSEHPIKDRNISDALSDILNPSTYNATVPYPMPEDSGS